LTSNANARYQAELKARRLEEGWKLPKVWIRGEQLEKLKERFPGYRGGVAWDKVAEAALSTVSPFDGECVKK
jgi:hypothetical protein